MATKEEFRWSAVPSWGCQGWDLGEWPLVVVSFAEGEDERDGYLFGVKVNTEGDVERDWFTTSEARDKHVARWARWWYFHYQAPLTGMSYGCLSWPYHQEFASSCPDCRVAREQVAGALTQDCAACNAPAGEPCSPFCTAHPSAQS